MATTSQQESQNISEELPDSILKKRCFSPQINSEIRSILSAIEQNTALPAFEFARIFDDGRAVILYSDTRLAQYIVETKQHLVCHVPEHLLANRFWFQPDPHGPYSHVFRAFKAISGVTSFVDLIERHHGYSDMYCFFRKEGPEEASSFFLNQKEALDSLSMQFKDKAKDLIANVSKDAFIMPQWMRPNFSGLAANEEEQSIDVSFHFEKIHLGLLQASNRYEPRLTSREVECVVGLSLGKTTPEIAQDLGLSFRTVEKYMDSVKSKLGCDKKCEIIRTLLKVLSA